MSRLSRVVPLGFVTFAVASCADIPENAASSAVVSDSAGVRVVQSTGTSNALLTVDSTPVFVAGWEPDAPLFSRPEAGLITDRGGAFVGESSEGRLYEFDPAGQLVRTLGRKGEGPGEFLGLDAILTRGDTVFVSDGPRLTAFGFDGAVETSLFPTIYMHQVSAFMPGGQLLLVPNDGFPEAFDLRPEWVFETKPILTFARSSSVLDTIAELPALRRWMGEFGASPGAVWIRGRAGGFSGGFAWARADVPEVRWFDASGELTQIARWSESVLSLESDYVERALAEYAGVIEEAGYPEDEAEGRLNRYRESLDRHDGVIPLWDQLVVDAAGNVWLSEHALPGQPVERWRVIRRDGEFLGWVTIPGTLKVLDVREDRVLVVRQDDFDVPGVAMHRLVRR